MDVARKPATGNGSNLVPRHLLTCSTHVPSFITRLPREPPQPTLRTDGRTRSLARDRKRSNGPYAKTSHGKCFKFGTQTPPDVFYQRTKFHPPPPPGSPSTDGRTGSRARDLKRSNGHCAKTSHRKWFKFGTQTPRDMFYQRTEFRSPPSTRSIGSPISISPLPVFFAEGRGAHRPRSPRRPRSFSEERYGQTERGRNSKFCRQRFSVMIYLSTKFHDHPIISSIGSPVSIFPLPVPPDLFGRGPRGLSASSALAAAASPPAILCMDVTGKRRRGEG